MNELTYREYKAIISKSTVDNEKKNALKKIVFGNIEDDLTLDELSVMKITKLKEYELVSHTFNCLGEDISPMLKDNKWKSNFIAVAHNLIGSESGYQKNILLNKILNTFINTESLTLSNKENSEYFLNIFKRAVKINNKNEEQSIVHSLYTLFQHKNDLSKDFLMELFAMYVENITPDSKYQGRIKEVKAWAINQDFSELSEKYPKIRQYLNQDKEEQICQASIKRYDLKEISEKTKTKLVWVQENFTTLNNFLEINLAGNKNIHSFNCVDDNMFKKVIIVYEKRDAMVNALTKIHDTLFETIKGTKNIEDEIINKLWKTIVLKEEIEKDLDKQDLQKAKINTSGKLKI